MRRSNEPLWWLPFSAGMMLDALAMPALILVTGVLVPLGFVSEGIRALFLHPLGRLGLFVLIAATFFHAAHRLRFTLQDLGLKPIAPVVAALCYGGAVIGTLVAGAVALGLL